MTRIRVWVEILTTQMFCEETMDAPDGWAQMSQAERGDWMAERFEKMRNELANGGFEEVER